VGIKAAQPQGALVIDTGTGEMKLMCVVKLEASSDAVEGHELALFKGDTMTTATTLADGDCSLLNKLVAEFAAGISKLKELPFFSQVSFKVAMIGATAWYRMQKGDGLKAAEAFLDTFTGKFDALLAESKIGTGGLEIRIVTGLEEAVWEKRAVDSAVVKSGLPAPLAVMAGGSGSVQLTGFEQVVSLEMPLKKGTALLKGDQAKGIAEWGAFVTDVFDKSEELAALKGFAAEEVAKGERLRLVLISGNYYAALKAGITGEGQAKEYVSGTAVLEKLRALRDSPNEDARDVVNAQRLHTVLSLLFVGVEDSFDCLFVRDFVLDGKAFRATWTSGWWLEWLSRPSP